MTEEGRTREREFHDGLVDELYDLAMARAKEQWPIAAASVHEEITTRVLTAALMRALAIRKVIYP